MKKRITAAVLAFCLLAGRPISASAASNPKETPKAVHNIVPTASKQSSKSIRISWDSMADASVKYYYLMKRAARNSVGIGAWKTLAKIASNGAEGGPAHSYTDQLTSSVPQQYEYKICTLSADKAIDTREPAYEGATDACAVLGTNIKVCIDPGHYGTLNNNYEFTGKDGNFPFSEAVFTLEIAKALREELRQAYGIDSFLTRTGESISLTYNGKKYTDENLDQKNIAVRGYVAKPQGCDFFISLHTNSTSRQSKIWSQPKSINKACIFVNQAAHASDRGMKAANAIGTSLTGYNKESGIQTAGFTTRSKGMAASFSTQDNDSAKTNGTVIHRKSSTGGDYYGVLRGASANGVEGILVEHAFHATQIVRKLATISTDLSENWAACDAYGIAYGFGFLDGNGSIAD